MNESIHNQGSIFVYRKKTQFFRQRTRVNFKIYNLFTFFWIVLLCLLYLYETSAVRYFNIVQCISIKMSTKFSSTIQCFLHVGFFALKAVFMIHDFTFIEIYVCKTFVFFCINIVDGIKLSKITSSSCNSGFLSNQLMIN